MWIVPKTNLTESFLSFPDIVESSEVWSLLESAGHLSLFVRSKPMRSRTLLRKWKTEKWFRLLSGRTLKLSQWPLLEEKLIFLPGAFLANLLALPEVGKPTTTPGTFSPPSSELSESADQNGFSLKTSQGSSLQNSGEMGGTTPKELRFSNMSSESWSEWVTEQKLGYSQRLKSEQARREKEFLFSQDWPTPRTGATGSIVPKRMGDKYNNLEKALALEYYGPRVGGKNSTGGRKTELWPTPRVVASRDSKFDRGKSIFGEVVMGVHGGTKEKPLRAELNPNWTEQLMGVPVGWTQLPIEWTDSDNSETVLSLIQLRKPGKLSGLDLMFKSVLKGPYNG